MTRDELMASARLHFDSLANNPYPGRGLVVGLDLTGENMTILYWIMGRSTGSRNRRFDLDGPGTVKVVPIDPNLVKDPELTLYTAMDEWMDDVYVVSNGNQTEKIADEGFEDAMFGIEHEPDEPHFTPRISAACYLGSNDGQPECMMAIHRKLPNEDEGYFSVYKKKLVPGIGWCLTTYKGEGDPLPSFEGHPYPLPLEGNVDDIALAFWEALDQENRVSLAVRSVFIGQRNRVGTGVTRIINQY